MASKPSGAPWADEPFRLIKTPSTEIKSDHFSVEAASQMTHAHNLLLRGLNAIIQQGPHVPDSTSPNYREKDVRDFLTYVHIWIETVHHHHWVEETYIFPEMEKSSGKPGLMDEPQHQHELFQEGLNSLKEYTSSTKPDEYRWEDSNGNGMKKIIDSFSKHLTDHLYAEIEVFLGLKDLDSAQFKKTWNKAEEIAKASGNIGLLYTMVPMVLGTADKTYVGAHDFPPFPWIMPYLVKYWFGAGNGAWRFSPCDFWGQPRPLAFIGEGSAGS